MLIDIIALVISSIGLGLAIAGIRLARKSWLLAQSTEELIMDARETLRDVESTVRRVNSQVQSLLPLTQDLSASLSTLKTIVESAIAYLGDAVIHLEEYVRKTTGELKASVNSTLQLVVELQESVQGLGKTLADHVEVAIAENVRRQAPVLAKAFRDDVVRLSEQIDAASTELNTQLEGLDQEMARRDDKMRGFIASKMLWARIHDQFICIRASLTEWMEGDPGKQVIVLVSAVLCLIGLFYWTHLLFAVP